MSRLNPFPIADLISPMASSVRSSLASLNMITRRESASIISGGIYLNILYLKRNFNTLILLELANSVTRSV